MNNYHLFLIRSDQVTQIIAHLVAGIAALVLISTLGASEGESLSDSRPASAEVMHASLPAGTEMIAATK